MYTVVIQLSVEYSDTLCLIRNQRIMVRGHIFMQILQQKASCAPSRFNGIITTPSPKQFDRPQHSYATLSTGHGVTKLLSAVVITNSGRTNLEPSLVFYNIVPLILELNITD